ncbi:hypothetical protein C8255_06205 [filamentous cyanobacterium CCP3]|nr:hypothetical protein C8255_06205 [filamentous cyanobacterium CCP3]
MAHLIARERARLRLVENRDRQVKTQLPHDFDKPPLWTMEKPEISVNLITIDGEYEHFKALQWRFSGASAFHPNGFEIVLFCCQLR